MGVEDTGDDLTLSEAVTLNQDHLITTDIFVVSAQILASGTSLFNCLNYIQKLPLHCQYNVFNFVVGKGKV